MEVNKEPVKAFVDSGAQMTIMTKDFAEKCGLMRLVDYRFAGIAMGVGQSKIIGRIYQVMLFFKCINTLFINSTILLYNCNK